MGQEPYFAEMWWKRRRTRQQVRFPLMGATSNLHVVDAHYHKDWYLSFIPKRNVQPASYNAKQRDYSIEHFIQITISTLAYTWTSVSYTKYIMVSVKKQMFYPERSLLQICRIVLGENWWRLTFMSVPVYVVSGTTYLMNCDWWEWTTVKTNSSWMKLQTI